MTKNLERCYDSLLKRNSFDTDNPFCLIFDLQTNNMGATLCTGNCYMCVQNCMKFLNEETEEPVLNDDEKTILKNIDKKYHWIVRDPDGTLVLFTEKPTRVQDDMWTNDEEDCLELSGYNHLFPAIKKYFSPYKIEELIL